MMEENSTRTPTFIQLTTRDGPLAQIWLASNMSHTLSKAVSQQTDIVSSVKEITKVAGCSSEAENVEPVTLRVSGELLHGVVRVYSKKASLLLNDIKDTLTKITSLFKTSQTSLTFQAERTVVSNLNQLILQDAVTERDVLVVPGLDFLEDHTITEGFMGGERSMQRHVQGAAPWDTSIEVGRKFAIDDDLDYDQSFGLDLDFDIKESEPKTWGEGTNTSINKSTISTDERLIGEDEDFPVDNSVAWDLGINEEADPGSEHESDQSIEIGRRAAQEELHEQTEFDFDLDLDKDMHEEPSESRTEPENVGQQGQTAARRNKRNSILANTKRLTLDEETELKDEMVRQSSIQSLQEQDVSSSNVGISLGGNKRLWAQIAESLEFLPQSVARNLLPYEQIKKQKTAREPIEANDQDFELDISLGLDNDLLSNYDESGQGNMTALSNDELDKENEEIVNGTSASADLHEFSSVASSTSSSVSQFQKVQLITGETVPRETVDMAELLRTQFEETETTTFDEIVSTRFQNEQQTEIITKRQASIAFFDVLSLATMGCLDLDQDTEFGEIGIKSRAPLYEKFVTA